MSILDHLLQWSFLRPLINGDLLAIENRVRQTAVRKDLDRRLKEVTKVTLEEDSGYFLKLVKENPDCVLEVIEKCDD